MLEVKGLKKTFKMSKKQQKIEKTKEKIKVAGCRSKRTS